MKIPPRSTTALADGKLCLQEAPSLCLALGRGELLLHGLGRSDHCHCPAGAELWSLFYSSPAAESTHLALISPGVPTHSVGVLAQGHSPLEDEVEPVSDYSHPDEPDAHCFTEVEPDGEEDKKSIPEISGVRDEEEPVLGALEALLQPVRRPDARVVQEVHVGLHPALLPLPSAWLWLSRTPLCHWGFILCRVLFAAGRSLSQH